MPEPLAEIPNRPAFKAAEVCEIAGIPPYVLKSWEKEFPGLGTETKPGGPRIYRRTDVEQVMRIKHLLFAEGLTLAGARRKLEGEPKAEELTLPDFARTDELRAKVGRIKRELRSLLELLGPGSAPSSGVVSSSTNPEEQEQRAATDEGSPLETEGASAQSWPPARASSAESGGADQQGQTPATGGGEARPGPDEELVASTDFLLEGSPPQVATSRKSHRSRRPSRKTGGA